MKAHGNWVVCVTTYEMCSREKHALKKFSWHYLVVDEAHRIKNTSAKLSDVLRGLKTQNRLLLTGTPLQNTLHELCALLHFLQPHTFKDPQDSRFNTGADNHAIARIQVLLRPFMLRRLKSEVEKELLPKKEIVVYVSLAIKQCDYYNKIFTKHEDIVHGSRVIEKIRLQNILMQLRKCANHPYLLRVSSRSPSRLISTSYTTAEN